MAVGEQSQRFQAQAETGSIEADGVPQGTISAERMHTILRRLIDGFYDTAEPRTVVAGRVALQLRRLDA